MTFFMLFIHIAHRFFQFPTGSLNTACSQVLFDVAVVVVFVVVVVVVVTRGSIISYQSSREAAPQ